MRSIREQLTRKSTKTEKEDKKPEAGQVLVEKEGSEEGIVGTIQIK